MLKRNSSQRVADNQATSLIAQGTVIRGDLCFSGTLHLEGRVEGSVTHTQRLTVGPQGTVKANIRAQLIVVEGTVEGDLHAEKSIFVKETAKVCGNMTAPTVSILEGACFSGNIDMGAKTANVRQTPKAASGAA